MKNLSNRGVEPKSIAPKSAPVRRSFVWPLLVGAVLSAFAGCANHPKSAPWKPDEKVIQPTGRTGRLTGALVVETLFLGMDNGKEVRRPFFLYDAQGQYLTHDFSQSPVPLVAGRYVVVTSVMNTNKRVQVVIRDQETTFVRLEDFKAAPEAAE